MKLNDLIRIGIFLAVLGFVFDIGGGSDPKPKPDDPPPAVEYTGSLKALHEASRTMDEQDRVNMSMGFEAAAKMLEADKRGLVSTTEVAQTYLLGVIEFNYAGLGKPSTKYPAVADEVDKAFTAVLGDEVVPMSEADRIKLATQLKEMSRAVR